MKIERSNASLGIRIITVIIIIASLWFSPIEIFSAEKNGIEIVEEMDGDIPSRAALNKLLMYYSIKV
jgi:hypothetical protein